MEWFLYDSELRRERVISSNTISMIMYRGVVRALRNFYEETFLQN